MMVRDKDVSLNSTPRVEKSKSFSATVEIGGEMYTFLGRFSDETKRIRLELRCKLTDDEVKKMLALGVNPRYVSQGIVALISARAGSGIEGTDVFLTGIMSLSDKVSKLSPRYGAHLGSFLLRNFLTLVDTKGWSVSTTLSPEGRLDIRDMEGWFRSQNFEGPNAQLLHIRRPQTPDTTQVISHFA